MISVRVRFYAGLRDITGAAELTLHLADNATLGDILEQLNATYGSAFQAPSPSTTQERTPGLQIFVNRKLTSEMDQVINDGSTVELFPPIAGGGYQGAHGRVKLDPLSMHHITEGTFLRTV